MAEEKTEPKTRKLEWMLKPCKYYDGEYKDCKSMRARFQQYYIYGELLDCSQLRIDHENCTKWKSDDDDEAYEALVTSEKARRLARLKPHYQNDVWTKRTSPPENWNSPLPEWMQQKFNETLLDRKQKEMEKGIVNNDLDVKLPFCTIL